MKGKSKSTNPVLWFLFAIVIPLIIATALAVLIMTLSGFNVGNWIKDTAQKVPVISSFITTEEDKNYDKELEKADEVIQEQKSEIDALHKDIVQLESVIEQLEQDMIKIENQMQSENNTSVEIEQEESEQNAQLKQLSASFKKMNKKQAALIFQDLEKETAIQVLQALSNDVRGGILEAMDPKEAAKLTELFLE